MINIVIILFLIILYLLSFLKKEYFKDPIISYSKMCKKIQDVKYRELSDSESQALRKIIDVSIPKKITYNCPDSNVKVKKSAVGKTVEPKLIKGEQYGFDPSDIKKLDSKLVRNIGGKEFVSNIDMVPVLVAQLKQVKIGGEESIRKSNMFMKKLTEMDDKLKEIESWKKEKEGSTEDI